MNKSEAKALETLGEWAGFTDPTWQEFDTFPTHYRDEDGPLCDWSGRLRKADQPCPLGCAGANEHYANDGHEECATG
jgi:hypothetical protein